MLFLHNTSRVEDDPHQNLLRDKGGTGFPYLVWMDEEGKVLAQQGERSVEGFEKTLETLQKYQDLKKQVEAGDKKAEVPLFLAELELGTVEFEEAKARLNDLEGRASGEQLDRAKGLLAALELQHYIGEMRQRKLDQDGFADAVIGMYDAKHIPQGSQDWLFWLYLAQAGAQKENAEILERGLKKAKELKGDEPQFQRFIQAMEEKLAELKKG